MADEEHQARPDLRIDLNREDDVRRWSEKFGVPSDELRQVVALVGDRIRAVGEELGRRALFGGDRPPPPRPGRPGRLQ